MAGGGGIIVVGEEREVEVGAVGRQARSGVNGRDSRCSTAASKNCIPNNRKQINSPMSICKGCPVFCFMLKLQLKW